MKNIFYLPLISFLFCLNLSLHDYDNPSATHILDAEVFDDLLIVVGMIGGIEFYDISNPSNPEYITTVGTVNAWAVRIEAFPDHPNYEFVVYIADGESIYTVTYMYDNNSHIFSPIDYIDLGDAVKDIAYDNGLVYFAKGTGGVDVYLTEGTLDTGGSTLNCSMHMPCYLDNYNTSVLANRIEVFNDKLAVADWDDIEILEWNGENLNLVGYKNTTRRTMAVATKDNYIYSAEWAAVQIFEYGEINGPDIDLNVYELNYPYVQNGESYSLGLDITNNGNEVLVIDEAYTTNNEFSSNFSLGNINPGETQTVDMIYTANSINASGSYRIYSNELMNQK